MIQQSGTSSLLVSLPVALVTGSSSGIGKAIALRLGRDGYHVLIHYNSNVSGAEDARSQILAAGGSAELMKFDVKDPQAIEQALDAYFGSPASKPIAVLVNNAGIHQDGLAGLMSDAAFDNVMKTNVYGPFYLLRWCIRRMIRQRSGCIVNISSLAGQTGNAGQINYAASKAALIAMTKTLAMEAGSRGIRVNAVAPGLIETEMLADLPPGLLDDLKKRIPLGRLGNGDEVAGAVAFLCSKDASYITGHTLSVNGGLLPT
jgi:3-oxoacyl-[acyl-carrier protein] reductase